MDPVTVLGITSGIIAIIQLTGVLISEGYSHIGALKDAPKELQALVDELVSLSGILSALKVQLETAQITQNSTQLSALELLNSPGGPLQSCGRVLEYVKENLAKLKSSRLGKYLVGYRDKDTKQHIEQLGRSREILQLALYVDQR